MERGIYVQPVLPHEHIEAMVPPSDSELEERIKELMKLSAEIEQNLAEPVNQDGEAMPSDGHMDLQESLAKIDLELMPLFEAAEQRGIFEQAV